MLGCVKRTATGWRRMSRARVACASKGTPQAIDHPPNCGTGSVDGNRVRRRSEHLQGNRFRHGPAGLYFQRDLGYVATRITGKLADTGSRMTRQFERASRMLAGNANCYSVKRRWRSNIRCYTGKEIGRPRCAVEVHKEASRVKRAKVGARVGRTVGRESG